MENRTVDDEPLLSVGYQTTEITLHLTLLDGGPTQAWMLDVRRTSTDELIATRAGNELDWVLAMASNHLLEDVYRTAVQWMRAEVDRILSIAP